MKTKYGRWTIIGEAVSRNNSRMMLCKCDCGTVKDVYYGHLKSGGSKSCGCFKKEVNWKAHYKHGLSSKSISHTWGAMMYRCYSNKNKKTFKNYGGRGIKVCKRWHDVKNFYKDMGERPNGKSLDRIDVNGDYKPSNCRWATPREQANNTRYNRWINFNGERKTLAEWARDLNIKNCTLYTRLIRGWSIERAFTTPVQK